MNKFFKITFCVLSIIFSQVALSEREIEIRTQTLVLPEGLKEAPLQINSDNAIVVDSTSDCDKFMVVFYEGKLKVYYAYSLLEELERAQELFDSIDKSDASHIYSDSNDPIFHAPVVNCRDVYYSNTEHCFVNAEKSIDIDGIIESPHIVLKAREIEIESFLIDTQTIELQSNSALSLLSSIKLTLQDKANFKFQPIIAGTAHFGYNYVALICVSVNKVELRCLPESFYLSENTICFN